VTEKRLSEGRLRKLSSYLIRVQDQERRRIARELHDSTGQKLAFVKMGLDSLGKRMKDAFEAAVERGYQGALPKGAQTSADAAERLALAASNSQAR